jgi:hypothetical protein
MRVIYIESKGIQNLLVDFFNFKLKNKEQVFLQLWIYAWMLHYLEAPADNYWTILVIAFFGVLTAHIKYVPIIFLGLQSFFIFTSLPKIANHTMLVLFVNMSLILYMIRNYYLEKELKLKLDKPIINYLLLLLSLTYFFAFFHKLNSTFFDLNLSCATKIYQNILRTPVGFILPNSTFFYQINIYSVLLVELVIALLLLIRLRFAFYVGFVFHALLGFAVFYDFSAVVFSLYFLLNSDESYQNKSKHIPIGAFILLLSLVPLLLVNIFNFPLPNYHFLTTLMMIIGFGFFLLPSSFQNFSFKFRKIELLLIVLFVLNAMTPYLGFKTVSNISMFSNLRTEGSFKNHLLINDELEISQNNNDLIWINSAYGPPEEWVVKKNQVIPFKELRRVVTELRNQNIEFFSVSYSRNGKNINLDNALTDHVNIPSLNFFERNLIGFRSINGNGVNSCQW